MGGFFGRLASMANGPRAGTHRGRWRLAVEWTSRDRDLQVCNSNSEERIIDKEIGERMEIPEQKGLEDD